MEKNYQISTVEQLREQIKAPHESIQLKILDHLEKHSIHFAACTRLAALYLPEAPQEHALALLRIEPGDAIPVGEKHLRIKCAPMLWEIPKVGTSVGGLLLIPGVQETLRINGVLRTTQEGVSIEVKEVFLQCPKAFIRSELWSPERWQPKALDASSGDSLSEELAGFVVDAPFALVGTADGEGAADVSPRGDPSGLFVQVLDERTLLLPDRTGNRLVDTLRNLIDCPSLSMAFVSPGAECAVIVHGTGTITRDPALLGSCAVKGKAPKVGVLIQVEAVVALEEAYQGLWQEDTLVSDFPSLGRMVIEQISPSHKILNWFAVKVFELINFFHKKFRLY